MKKKILLPILLCSSMVATMFTGCGEKNGSETTTPTSEVESTTMEDTTTIVEETTSEEVTNEVEEPTSPSDEATSEAPTTEEETTTVVEETTTSKVEETTKAPVKEEPTSPKVEPTTETPTNAPEPPTTSPSVDSASLEKLKSLHIAIRPEESNMVLDPELCDKYGGFVFVPGPNYREMADYVDSDCGDGTKPNPYTMYEWTTRKYWGDRDEVTVGFYCYQEDIDDYNNGKGILQIKSEEMRELYDYSYDGCHIKIGTYEGRDIYFKYYFLR